MKRLLIIGASGFGRELLLYARDVPRAARDWEVGGFLDANPAALDGFGIDLPIVGDPATYEPSADDVLVPALGDPATKLRVARALQARGGRFVSVIHPTANVPMSNRLGVGLVFCPFSGVTTNVTIGDFAAFNSHSGCGHDAIVGDGCTFSAHSEVTGRVVLGEGVFLGSHATVLQGLRVGDYAKIGAGAVVVRNVKAGTSVFGNPARQIAGFTE